MAKRHSWRSVLLSLEDVVQEGTVVLWKILVKYRKAKPEELVKIFMVSFRRHLVAICKKEGIKNDRYVTSLEALAAAYDARSVEAHGFSPESFIRLRDGGKGEHITMLPWDYYAMRLKELSKRIGRKNVEALVHEGRKATKSYEFRKEEVLRALEG